MLFRSSHLAIVGYSRGGGVALLHAARTGSTLPIVDIAGMVRAQENFLQRGTWPSTEWSRPAGQVVTSGDLARFHEVVHRMAGTR